MTVEPPVHARLLGRLVLKGILRREDVERVFLDARAEAEGGGSPDLGEMLVARRLIDRDRLVLLAHTDGDDVPDLPGHEYVRKLGEGGTANVFEVRRKDGAVFAVKILHDEIAKDPAQVQAFLAEAKLLARLEHPNIVKGHKAGRIGTRWVSIMELVSGRTLQEAIAEGGAFDEDGALYVVLQVARALEYLRAQGVVHRDIKPGNILVTDENEVKVIDLGFAVSGEAAGSGGTTAGTAAYLSPEQARGQSDLDVRSDIYALGATLYQLVLGELPFSGDDAELVQKAVLEGLSAQATKGGRISAPMHYFIEKMMAKDRDIRYQSPQELIRDIEQKIEGARSLELPEADGDDEAEARRRRLARMKRKRRLR
ncbi:MAG: serine/threonine protein kinase [Planctomycetes bacterium]|nr:serine/threonine protein kinase [Planctomycetota bacterium]